MNHYNVSLVKSAIRIGAGIVLLLTGNLWIALAGVAFIVAEILGVVEEVVEQ